MAAVKKASKKLSELEEILLITNEDAQEDGEERNDFIDRLAVALNKLDDAEYRTLSKAARTWANAAVQAYDDNAVDSVESLEGMVDERKASKGKAAQTDIEDEPEPEPEPEEDEPPARPKAKARPVVEDEDEPPARPKAKVREPEPEDDEPPARPKVKARPVVEDDDEPPVRPKVKARPVVEDEDEPAPRPKAKVREPVEEDEPAPRAKATPAVEATDEEPRLGKRGRRPGHSNDFRKLIVDYWGRKDQNAMILLARKKGLTLDEPVMRSLYSQTSLLMRYLAEKGLLVEMED